MKPIEIGLADHVNMFVNDLEESVNFYHRVFGTDLKPKAEGFNKGVKWCIIGIPKKFYFCLYQLRKPQTHDPDALHINHIGFHVPDFDETLNRIKALGIKIEYRGKPILWKGSQASGSSRSVYIKDPNGYYIEFSEYFGGRLD
jgi:catechol 2,3-dioxygenase-like lactoylglutathione lyase family enzyme